MNRMGWALGALGFGAGLVWGFRRVGRRVVSLEGKVALITGGTRGFGLALARELAACGATVAICGRNERTLFRARDDLHRRGARVLAIQADLTDPQDVESVVRRVKTMLGPVDILVNNAGLMQVGPHDSMTEADHRTSLEIHYWAPLRLMEAVLPDMKRRGSGTVVNISSIGGRIAVPHMLPYVGSKFALTALSRGMRMELARYGVRVLTVFPGPMNTGGPQNATYKGEHRGEYTWFALVDRAPVMAVAASFAARKVRQAIETGRHELVIGPTARLGLWVHDLAPSLTYGVFTGVERLLPAPTGDVQAHRGWDSRSRLSRRAPFSRRLRRAARDLNQEGSA